MPATWTSAIRVTFRQKRAFVAFLFRFRFCWRYPTFVICARCNESISVTSFCTGNSRSGRITMATSGFARFNSSKRAASESPSTISLLILMFSSRSIEIVWTLRLANRRVRRAARRNHQIHAVFQQRRRDHENDQQHEGEIEQRGDIDLASVENLLRFE